MAIETLNRGISYVYGSFSRLEYRTYRDTVRLSIYNPKFLNGKDFYKRDHLCVFLPKPIDRTVEEFKDGQIIVVRGNIGQYSHDGKLKYSLENPQVKPFLSFKVREYDNTQEIPIITGITDINNDGTINLGPIIINDSDFFPLAHYGKITDQSKHLEVLKGRRHLELIGTKSGTVFNNNQRGVIFSSVKHNNNGFF